MLYVCYALSLKLFNYIKVPKSNYFGGNYIHDSQKMKYLLCKSTGVPMPYAP